MPGAADPSPVPDPGPGSDPAGLRARAEQVAASLPALVLAAERLAATLDAGAHGRRRAGPGDEFWQFRAAQPGDAAAAIDWRRSARSDAAFVREREAQAPDAALMWVAATPGMDWTGDPARPTKRARADLIALALGIALIRGGERVARAGAPPRAGRGQVETLARDLALAPVSEDAFLPPAAALRPAMRLVLIGDFLDDPAPLSALLARAAAVGATGGALVQVLDPVEEAFPFQGALRFRTPGGLVHPTRNAAALRTAYLARLAQRRADLARMAEQAGMRFVTHLTDAAPAQALMALYRSLAR